MTSLTAQQWFNNAWERSKTPIAAIIKFENDEEIDQTCVYHPQPGIPGCFIGVSLDLPEINAIEDITKQWRLSALNLFDDRIIDVSDMPTAYETSTFLDRLQTIHDDQDPTDWELSLRAFANSYNLQVPENK